MKTLIEFAKLDWIIPSVGVRYKEFIKGNQKLRLVEFSEGFFEADWCTKGHIGYVIEGQFKIDFSGEIANFSKGDALWIPEGEENKHKLVIMNKITAKLILFEKN